jgi:hypothetical protein
VHSSVTASTHGTPSTSCPSMTNATIKANGSMPGFSGAHINTRNNLTATGHNSQTAAHLQTPTRITNKTPKPKT